jgi:hypothetical protein
VCLEIITSMLKKFSPRVGLGRVATFAQLLAESHPTT